MSLNIYYQDVITTDCLCKEKWLKMIEVFIGEMKKRPISNLLYDALLSFTKIGYTINITNKNDFNSYSIYPHTFYKDKTVYVVLPSVPYFINVPVISEYTSENNNNDIESEIEKLSKHGQINDIIKYDIIEKHTKIEWEYQTFFMIFIQLVINTARYCMKTRKESTRDIYDTIYGVDNFLNIDGVIITENVIRKELGKKARISDDSQLRYVSFAPETFVNRDTYKEYFYLL